MIKKVLIANRGEIAVRIIKACHDLDIEVVAVYSEVDETAMHVREADEAYLLGPAPPNESYLKQDKLIEVAKLSGCDAVHPGYGFLAENAGFAQKTQDAGLKFVGPTPEAITLLGDKVASRRTMSSAGVPVIPGYDEPGMSDEVMAQRAKEIGYPVLIKAAAGGGGKGMRVVHEPENFQASLDGARREAQSAFGNPTVFLEKFLVEPRHIEFQIFSDEHGNHLHLFERECSIQRRHQKIIEETPSIALDDELRRRMGQTAVKVAEAANYTNAGTVEFLLDKDKNYYFLEVNTRIQVEHPITEVVVGVDLVKQQFRVASGEKLTWKQSDLTQRGHATECRIYAEDAAQGFLPAAGKAYSVAAPFGPGIRFDSGVESGDEVSVYYDPIVAKLVTWGETRDQSIAKAVKALSDTSVLGLTTNNDFLIDVLKHPEYLKGNLHINFLDEHIPNWKAGEISEKELLTLLSVAASVRTAAKTRGSSDDSRTIPDPWEIIGQWEIGGGK